MMKTLPVNSANIFILVSVSAALVTAQGPASAPAPVQNTGQAQPPQTKKQEIAAKRYQEQEPVFKPPPIPLQRRTVEVASGAEKPPSFFQSQHTDKNAKIEARQFDLGPQQQFDLGQQQFHNNPHRFNTFQQQPNSFQQQQQPQQRQQQQPLEQNQFQQFNNQPQNQQQNFQQFQQQDQQSFQDQNNFQSRQNENLPTLPPVFIPPNNPIGPPPELQSPIRNLFREPEPPFSLAGLFQRFLRIFNINN